jgi:cyclopropane fatty-acyl-phospholipid synthase-like methyltransferase
MKKQTDLYNSTYGKFTDAVLTEIRQEAFGQDIGQNSWITATEMQRLLSLLSLKPTCNLLEVACGSGGPAMYIAEITACNVTGVDNNENGIATAEQLSAKKKSKGKINFQFADANSQMPFDLQSFDAIVCMDAINHFTNRARVLSEWNRLLKPAGRFLYTDPIVVTGPLSNEEIAIRSSIGFFLFVPSGTNEQWIEQTGFRLIHREDVTSDAAKVAKRWHAAREKRKKELFDLEGEERFQGLQLFLDVVYRLYNEQRLSRFVYIGEKL